MTLPFEKRKICRTPGGTAPGRCPVKSHDDRRRKGWIRLSGGLRIFIFGAGEERSKWGGPNVLKAVYRRDDGSFVDRFGYRPRDRLGKIQDGSRVKRSTHRIGESGGTWSGAHDDLHSAGRKAAGPPLGGMNRYDSDQY